MVISLVQVAAEQDNVSAGVGGQIGLANDHDVERLCKEFVQGSELVDIGTNIIVSRTLLPIAFR